MRHIPEEELHAYLDQALSRSQCVEIESHLASCPGCSGQRDDIAALRDRTTALLTRLTPGPIAVPAWESLRRRADVERSARRRRVHQAAWAASLVAAVGLGWSGALFLGAAPRAAQPAPTAGSGFENVAVSPGGTPAHDSVLPPAPATPTRVATRVAARSAVSDARRRARSGAPSITDPSGVPDTALALIPPPAIEPAALELSSLDTLRANGSPDLDGVWRTLSWDGAREEAGNELPRIGGLPVVEVQVQAASGGARPLMVVAQQLRSGQMIRTIEGPAADVSHLLARRPMSDPDPSTSLPGRSDPPNRSGQPDHMMAMQRGDRMLAITGALPSDSLRAMIRRLNAELRTR